MFFLWCWLLVQHCLIVEANWLPFYRVFTEFLGVFLVLGSRPTLFDG